MGGILDPILSALFSDPSGSVGGNALMGILGLKSGNPGASTSTPLAPVPSQLGSPFAFRQGLLGDSTFANGIRGGLAGLAGSNGYTGLSAVGAGAQSAIQSGRQRQEFNIQNMLAGQQYQSGQQGLIGGNIQNSFTLYKVNALRANQGLPPISMSDLTANPNLVNDPYGSGGASGAGQPQQASGISPTAQGGQPESTFQPGQNGYGQGQSATQGSAPQSAPDSNDPGDPRVQAQLKNDALIFGAPYAQMELDAMKSGLSYLQASEAAKAKGQVYNLRAGSSLYDSSGNELGKGNPQKTEVLDPSGSGNMVPAVIYPDGRVEISGYGGSTTGAATNNPGNIRPPGQSTGFQNYPSIGAGVDAIDKNLQAYNAKGINTLSGIISTWSPSSENDTSSLIANAAKRLGVDPNKPLNMGDPNTRAQVAMAIMQQENGVSGANNSSVMGTNAGASPVSKLGPYATETQEGWAKRRSELGEFADSGIQAEQRFQALAQALKATQSGTFATDKARVAGALHAVGIDLPDSVLGDPAQMQIALKESTQGVFSQIKSLVGGRVAAQEINLLASASASGNLQPAANAKIIAQAIGAIRYQRDYYQSLSSQKNPTDPDQFEIQFQKDHPLQTYVDAAEKEIGPLKGMQGGGSAPNAAPAKILGNGDYNKLPSGAQFIGPDGKLRQKP